MKQKKIYKYSEMEQGQEMAWIKEKQQQNKYRSK